VGDDLAELVVQGAELVHRPRGGAFVGWHPEHAVRALAEHDLDLLIDLGGGERFTLEPGSDLGERREWGHGRCSFGGLSHATTAPVSGPRASDGVAP
jgi:hypothetical protein